MAKKKLSGGAEFLHRFAQMGGGAKKDGGGGIMQGAENFYMMTKYISRKEGKDEGLLEGYKKGKSEGLVEGIAIGYTKAKNEIKIDR